MLITPCKNCIYGPASFVESADPMTQWGRESGLLLMPAYSSGQRKKSGRLQNLRRKEVK